jgi:hypothetical protein
LVTQAAGSNLVTPVEYKPRLSEEELRDTLRDFLKSESQGMLDLRTMQTTQECLIRGIANLRTFAIATIVLSGVLLGLTALVKIQVFEIDAAWPHLVAFGVVVASIVTTLCWYFRTLYLSGRAERLVAKYADFS